MNSASCSGFATSPSACATAPNRPRANLLTKIGTKFGPTVSRSWRPVHR
jgi:hypothetical protein